MSTIDAGKAARSGHDRFRWTREQYYAIADLGFFDDCRVELIGGEIRTMTTNPPHAIAMEMVSAILFDLFRAGYRIRTQSPLDLGRHNQPEPDAAVLLRGDRIELVHPETALLAIEVSDSTLRKDRTIKAPPVRQGGHRGLLDPQPGRPPA